MLTSTGSKGRARAEFERGDSVPVLNRYRIEVMLLLVGVMDLKGFQVCQGVRWYGELFKYETLAVRMKREGCDRRGVTIFGCND